MIKNEKDYIEELLDNNSILSNENIIYKNIIKNLLLFTDRKTLANIETILVDSSSISNIELKIKNSNKKYFD